MPVNPPDQSNDTTISREHWRWTALAGMASYLDAGSIVALGAGLALFQRQLGLTNGEIGILAAIGPNAIGCAIGAVLGGRLGDKLGRKRIYQYDLIVYALGILCIALATNRGMLFAGTFVVGLAVGADVPTSLALVGEFAPAKARGRLLGFTQVAWSLGPVIVLWLAFALAPLGMLGIRIVFLQLFVVALVTWALRRRLKESARWQSATASSRAARPSIKLLFSGRNLGALAYTATFYLFWNLAAGTIGIFSPYIISTLHAGGQAASVGLTSVSFLLVMIVTIVAFMPNADRSYGTRRGMWLIGSLMQILAFALFLFLPFNIPTVVANIVLFGIGQSFAGEAFYKVFSQELFPTLLRGTAQGFTFGIARTVLGFWSLVVPILTKAGIGTVAALLTLFLAISGVVGYVFMPDTSGKNLEQIERERA
jgi:inositol transporter-like SP family MFS transporter